MREFEPIKTIQPKPGVFVYDLGQNFAGWPQLAVQGPAGSTVKLIPGELLDGAGRVSQRSSGGPVWFSYTLKGGGREVWHPRFSYYGFRYVQVEGAVRAGSDAPSDRPRILDLTGQFVHSSAQTVGHFSCSNRRINRIHELIDAAILSNLQSVLTDCPHREKLGWLEVSHLLAGAVAFNYDVPLLYAKICRDMRESQLPSGLVPDIAPEYTVLSRRIPRLARVGKRLCLIDPWHIYQWYGDPSPLTETYDAMKRYAAYLGGKAREHIVSHGLGDWYDVGPRPPGESQLTSKGLTATAIYYRDLTILEQTADLLGNIGRMPKTMGHWRPKCGRHSIPRSSIPTPTATTAIARPPTPCRWRSGLVAADRRAAVLENLVKAVRAGGNHVTAGDVGFHVSRAGTFRWRTWRRALRPGLQPERTGL